MLAHCVDEEGSEESLPHLKSQLRVTKGFQGGFLLLFAFKIYFSWQVRFTQRRRKKKKDLSSVG